MLIYGIEKGDMLECTIQPSGIPLAMQVEAVEIDEKRRENICFTIV